MGTQTREKKNNGKLGSKSVLRLPEETVLSIGFLRGLMKSKTPRVGLTSLFYNSV
jgi:hypothetical protein